MKKSHYKCHFYRDAAGEWRWRLKARNGRIVADSAEGYTRKDGAERAWWQLHTSLMGTYWVDRVVDE